MHIYYVPNFHRGDLYSSQNLVLRRYYTWLVDAGYEVTVLFPDDYEDVARYIGCSTPVFLPVTTKTSESVVFQEYAAYLRRQKDLNNSLIITHQSWSAHMLYTALFDGRYVHPKIVNHFVENHSDYSLKEPRMAQRLLGMAMLPTIHNSQWTKDEARQIFEKTGYYDPMIVDGHYVVPLGTDLDAIPKRTVDRKSMTERPFRWVYPGNTLMSFKQIDKQIKIFDEMYKSNQNFTVTYHVLDSFRSKVPDRPYIILDRALPQKDFWKKCADDYDAFVCTSKNESYGFAYWELLEIGLAGMFWLYPWVESMLGSKRAVFSGRSVKEIASGGLQLMRDYETVSMMQATAWETVRSTHLLDECRKDYFNTIDDIARQYRIRGDDD